MNDLHMDFMSEKDFDRLSDAMDLDGAGFVDPIVFFSFLAECGPQFKEVHREYSSLPKSERIKLAARRLSNISAMGQEGVKKMERRNNRRSRLDASLGGLDGTFESPFRIFLAINGIKMIDCWKTKRSSTFQ